MAGALGLRSCPVWDPYHRVWNDFKRAVHRVGQWPVVMETVICMNLPHGPCMSESFGQHIVEALEHVYSVNGPEASPVETCHVRTDALGFGI